MNLIQQAVARADQDRAAKAVITPLEPLPNLGSIHSRSFRPVPLAPSRTPLAAIGLAILALAGGAALYVALAHSRDEVAAVSSAFSQVGLGGKAADAAAPVTPTAAATTPSTAPAATPAVAAAPAPAPTARPAAQAAATPPAGATDASGAAPADPLMEARYTIEAWARAWSDRDVDAYLAYYGEGFTPDKGASRAAWAKARRQAIERRKEIAVKVDNLQLVAETPTRVVARYTQDYAADDYRENGTPKRLVLAREGGLWRIVAEASAAASR